MTTGIAMKRVLEYTSLIYALMVFVGFLNMNTYFGYFGIDIHTHLSVGELLMSFLPMTEFLMWMSGVWVYMLLLNNGTEWVLDKVKSKASPRWQKWGWALPAIVALLFVSMFVFGLWINIEMVYALFTERHMYMESRWIAGALFWPLLVLALGWFIGETTKRQGWKYLGIVCAAISGLIFLVSWNYASATKVIVGKGPGVVIELDGRTIRTDQTWAYIGKCNEAVFLWDRVHAAALTVYTKDIRTMYLTDPSLRKRILDSKPATDQGRPTSN